MKKKNRFTLEGSYSDCSDSIAGIDSYKRDDDRLNDSILGFPFDARVNWQENRGKGNTSQQEEERKIEDILNCKK